MTSLELVHRLQFIYTQMGFEGKGRFEELEGVAARELEAGGRDRRVEFWAYCR